MTKITLKLCDNDLASYQFHAAFQGVSLEHYIMRTVITVQEEWHRYNGTTSFTAQPASGQSTA